MKQTPYDPARPASESIFVGREVLKPLLTNGLLMGRCFSLTGGKGTGKTSFLWAIQRELATPHNDNKPGPLPLPVYIECQHHHSIEEILVRIITRMVDALHTQRGLICPSDILQQYQVEAKQWRLETTLKLILDWAYAQEKRTHLPILLIDDFHRISGNSWVWNLASILQTIVNQHQLSLVLAGQQILLEKLRDDVASLQQLIVQQYSLEPFTFLETNALIDKALDYGWRVEKGFADWVHKFTSGHPYRLHYYLYNVLLSEGQLALNGLTAFHKPETVQHLNTMLRDNNVEKPTTLHEQSPDHNHQIGNYPSNSAQLSENAIQITHPVMDIQHQAAFKNPSVQELLLLELHRRTQNEMMLRIDQLKTFINHKYDHIIAKEDDIISELNELRELEQRRFLIDFRREQAAIESHCPNIFVLRLREDKKWLETIRGKTLELQLYCQAPGCWHPTTEGGLYEIDESAQWLKTISPYLNQLISVLKYAAPLIGPWLGEEINTQDYKKLFRRDIETMQELAKQLSNTDLEPECLQGAALRSLRHLLIKQDPQQHWGGLRKVLTSDGYYLWLCEYHAQEYQHK